MWSAMGSKSDPLVRFDASQIAAASKLRSRGQPPQERNAQHLSSSLPGWDRTPLSCVRSPHGHSSYVLNQTQDRRSQLCCHSRSLADNHPRKVLRRSHEDYTAEWNGLHDCQRSIRCPGRQINHQAV